MRTTASTPMMMTKTMKLVNAEGREVWMEVKASGWLYREPPLSGS
jgi:hypothetical protein